MSGTRGVVIPNSLDPIPESLVESATNCSIFPLINCFAPSVMKNECLSIKITLLKSAPAVEPILKNGYGSRSSWKSHSGSGSRAGINTSSVDIEWGGGEEEGRGN